MRRHQRFERQTTYDLGQVPLFAAFSPRALKGLTMLGTYIQVEAGRELITAGDTAAELVIVMTGAASCRIGGREVATFGPGEFFGEVAMLDGGPRTATVTADTDMDIWVLNRCEFDELLSVLPGVAPRMLRSMARRLRAVDVCAA
jgi:CRP/FNR family transcriptional regulator, cyclic AMP receptor protein